MAGKRSPRTKLIRAGLAAVASTAVAVAVFAGSSSAQTDNNQGFAFAGYTTQAGKAISVSTDISGDLGFCRNANGLGSELYFNGSGTNGTLAFRQATVSPMVVPIQIGVVSMTSTDPEATVSDDFVTIGVAQGSPADFGTAGPSQVQYGGIATSPTAIGVISWKLTADSSCAESRVMPILQPIVSGGSKDPLWGAAPAVTTTTDTTVPPTTDTTTTVAPTTTDTTVPPTTDTTTTIP